MKMGENMEKEEDLVERLASPKLQNIISEELGPIEESLYFTEQNMRNLQEKLLQMELMVKELLGILKRAKLEKDPEGFGDVMERVEKLSRQFSCQDSIKELRQDNERLRQDLDVCRLREQKYLQKIEDMEANLPPSSSTSSGSGKRSEKKATLIDLNLMQNEMAIARSDNIILRQDLQIFRERENQLMRRDRDLQIRLENRKPAKNKPTAKPSSSLNKLPKVSKGNGNNDLKNPNGRTKAEEKIADGDKTVEVVVASNRDLGFRSEPPNAEGDKTVEVVVTSNRDLSFRSESPNKVVISSSSKSVPKVQDAPPKPAITPNIAKKPVPRQEPKIIKKPVNPKIKINDCRSDPIPKPGPLPAARPPRDHIPVRSGNQLSPFPQTGAPDLEFQPELARKLSETSSSSGTETPESVNPFKPNKKVTIQEIPVSAN